MQTENEIIKKFNDISKKGYIAFENNYYAGINLEKLLGKSGDCFNIPDYDEFEIKTIQFNSIFKSFELFSCRPDGPYAFSTRVIADKYGYPDKDFKNVNVIKGTIYGNKKNKIGLFYYYKICIDYSSKKVLLNVYNHKKEFINTEAFWYFDSLLEKLNRKLQNVAIFYYKQYSKNNIHYIWYNHLELYTLKNSDAFIGLIEDGIITINLKCGVNKSGKYIGSFKDRGSSFRIDISNIDDLFYKIYVSK